MSVFVMSVKKITASLVQGDFTHFHVWLVYF